ncbi:cadherin domain-containing protein [Candidatus Leptofilum sp.]|uniref:cadherin domain-containing protein n=1 Tax=Candidatus Leptofilum sp. TaxID=3241576 RepID=UPI003B5CE240
MRRKRVLLIFTVLFGMVMSVFWLGNVLADATVQVNQELVVNEGDNGIIDNSLLLSDDDPGGGGAVGAIMTYTLVTTPANGILTNTNTATTLTPTAQFTQSDIDNGFLQYTHDDSETLSDSFDFTVATSMTMASDTFVITITPDFDQTPVVDDQTFSVPENSTTGTAVDTIVASDLDAGDSLTYTITGGNFGSPFAVDSGNGAITVDSPTPLDFETNETLTFTVEITDMGMLTDTAVITINVQNVNEPPTLNDDSFSLPENSANGTAVGTVTASDPDAADAGNLTFDIIAGNTGSAFAISNDGNNNGDITVADTNQLDFETTPTFTLTVQVEDSGMNLDEAEVVIDLTNVNEPPTTSNATYTPNENLGTGEGVGNVLATDPEGVSLNYEITAGDPMSAFNVNAAGQIVVSDTTQLDFETTLSYTLTIAVDDSVNSAVDATVFINLQDLNELPSVSGNTFAIDENSSNGTAVGTVTASDPDADDAGMLTFDIISGNTGGAFAISNDGNNNGDITVANTNQLDFETTESFTLGIIVTDTGWLGPNLSNTASITININNLYDESPSVSNATFFVSEGDADGVLAGTVSATDVELSNGDELTFSIEGGNVGSVFAINSSSGQITVPDTSKLDADAMPTFNLTVQAIDRGGNADTATITVNVSPLPITYIFLPTVLNNYPPIEPNNNCSQAFGLGNNINYEFTADDQEDWYSFTVTSQQDVTITLSDFEPASGQLIVYSGTCSSLTLLQNNGSASSTKIINLTNLGAGTYYIRVFSAPVTNTDYNLRVDFN